MKNTAISYLSAALTFLTYVIGGWDIALEVLVIFMCLDYLTGIISGYIMKTLSSAIGFKGILKKCTIIFILNVAVCLDRLMNNGTWVFRTLVAYFFIANEGISILENSVQMGLPIPQKLIDVLSQIKDKEDNTIVK
jgi:toxin secretion/phage lysis holin